MSFIIVELSRISERTKNIYQLGAGRTGPGDCDINYPLMQLHLSKSKIKQNLKTLFNQNYRKVQVQKSQTLFKE